MGDIFLRVTAGPSPNIDWTVAVEFFDKKTWVPPKQLPMPGNIHEYPEPKAVTVNDNVVLLMQVVKTATEQKVVTLQYQEYYFRFCPDRGTGNR